MAFLGRHRAGWARWTLLWLAALALVAPSAQAQSSEYKLKAAYLCRFVDFIDWPAGAFSATNSPLVIGVLGSDPFGSALEEVADGQSSRGHPLVIRRFASVNDISVCHILFISSAEAPALIDVLRALEGKPILTVGDVGNFTAHGGMIRFFTDKNKVRFRINLDAAKACRLSISSRLLQLADLVKEGPAAP